jgi:hypothetical protein
MDQGHAVSLFAGCVIWVPLAVWIIALTGWMVQGEIDVLAGMAGLLLGVGLGALAFISPDPNVAPYLCVGVSSVVVLFPLAKTFKEKRELAMIDLEEIEIAYDQLADKPDNVGAKIKMAKTLHKRGAQVHAAALAEQAMKGLSPDIFQEEFRLIKNWKRSLGAGQPNSLACLRCGAKNKLGDIYCYRCKAPVLLHFAKGHWVDPGLFKKLLTVWIAVVAAIVGIPVAGYTLPTRISAPVVVAILLLDGVIIWAAFTRAGRSVA